MTCIMRDCYAPAAKGDAYCAPCGHWARVTLSDPKYCTQKPPACPVSAVLPGFEPRALGKRERLL